MLKVMPPFGYFFPLRLNVQKKCLIFNPLKGRWILYIPLNLKPQTPQWNQNFGIKFYLCNILLREEKQLLIFRLIYS